jgi:hypothetical protein
MDRRSAGRHSIQVPVNISTAVRRNRVGMIRDVSASGVLFHSRSQFALGERVTIEFHVASGERGETSGEVVRASTDARDDALFRVLTAVKFDIPLDELPRPPRD